MPFHSLMYVQLPSRQLSNPVSRLGGEAITAAILPPAPILQLVVVTSGDKTKEKNNMANGYNTLLAIMICAKHDPDSNALSALNFPVPTEAFKRVSELTTKDERVRALKKTYWTLMGVPGSEHNMMVMSRDYSDVDPIVPAAIITGIYAKILNLRTNVVFDVKVIYHL